VARRKTGFQYVLTIDSKIYRLDLQDSIISPGSSKQNSFTFLNITYHFKKDIDWNFSKHGKLWTYNLNYFEYLQQEGMTKAEGLFLINDFIKQQDKIKDGLEPFPISLRGINWIKFLNQHKIKNQKIEDALLAQYYILKDNLEYHLLGNHLLENGFSLLFGAYFFRDEELYDKAKEILEKELNEQILEDGAHFELSPMYHQLMLFRVLDCINLVKNNSYKDQDLLPLLEEKATIMLGWINTMTFKNGNIPLFNDCANGIAPTTRQLNSYAIELNSKFKIQNSKLTKSGYRKFSNKNYELLVDVGNIGPNYIPGHAHADTFNFELYIDQKPFIVDTGLSTYEKNDRRTKERSTVSHNTVEVNNKNSSEVWSGFRVAKRAKIIELKEEANQIIASHNGYKNKFGIIHTREWNCKEHKVVIKDNLNKTIKAIARLHFHPDVTEEMVHKHVVVYQNSKFKIQNYKYALEFNKVIDATVMEIAFEKELEIEIHYDKS